MHYLYFWEVHIGNTCAIVCFNVSILGKYYVYMYYNVLPSKLTHSLISFLFTSRMKEVILGRLELAVTESVLASFTHDTHSIHP